ncbi:MAG: glycosyltransferase, partial [Planctomycetia bacterium]
MTHVCHLLHSLDVGGAELLAAALARRLRVKGFTFSFGCLDHPGRAADELRADGFRVESFDRKPGFDARLVWRLARWFAAEKPAVVHAHQYTPFFYAAASRVPRWRPLPIVMTEHGRTHPDFRRPKRAAANRLLLRPFDRVVGVGEAVRRALVDNEGFPPPRVGVVVNGINGDPITAALGERGPMRTDRNTPPDAVVVVLVARLDPVKNHRLALDAFRLARETNPALRLWIVGDGSERAVVEGRVAELGLTDAVTLLGERRDVPALLAAADVLLL